METNVQEVSIKALTIRPDLFQTRAILDPEFVKAYANMRKNGSPFPPVTVIRDKTTLYLVNGHTRVEAALKLRQASIAAMILDGTATDGLLISIGENSDKYRSRQFDEADRRHAVEMMIRNPETRAWSDTEISRRCGLSLPSVQKARVALESRHGIPLPEKIKIFRDGKLTGRVQRYRISKKEGTESRIHSVNQGGHTYFRMHFMGRNYHLGSNLDAAKAAAEQLLSGVAKNAVVLGANTKFAAWLSCRGISCRVGGLAGSPITCIRIGPHKVIPLADASVDGVIRAIGLSVLLDQKMGDTGRSIIVCYRENKMVGQLVNLAAQLPRPIEFMTPEEVVAEFGPKAEEGGEE